MSYAVLAVALAEARNWTPSQIRSLTLLQATVLAYGYEKTDEAARYRAMSPEVREIADRFKRRHGRF